MCWIGAVLCQNTVETGWKRVKGSWERLLGVQGPLLHLLLEKMGACSQPSRCCGCFHSGFKSIFTCWVGWPPWQLSCSAMHLMWPWASWQPREAGMASRWLLGQPVLTVRVMKANVLEWEQFCLVSHKNVFPGSVIFIQCYFRLYAASMTIAA